jgi:hypothetical protein
MAKRKPARRFLNGCETMTDYVWSVDPNRALCLRTRKQAEAELKRIGPGATIYEVVPVKLGK